jgi:hypothetical protein
MKNGCILVGKSERNRPLGDLDIGGKIILKWSINT